MSNIIIRRKYEKSPSEARAAAEHMASELKEEFDLDFSWEDEVMHFKRPGVSGELTLDSQEVVLSIRLGFLLAVLKPSIEREINRFIDENFQA